MKRITILLWYLLICLLPLNVVAQEMFSVRGVVSDKQKQTMPGVSVYVKNSPGIGVATNSEGIYQIKVKVTDVLIFSFVGFKPREILMYKQMETVNVVLEEDMEVMDEVEVVGYGTQRKVSVLGAITTIDPEQLRSASVTSLSNSLSGRMAGIIGVQRSGEPGEDVSEFWIRGISTFGAKASALFLIDGVERDQGTFNNLSPEDIESFSILKDASATAIYGARGASGVVIVTTKRGKSGRMTINANLKAMVEYLPKLPDYLRSYDYARLANEARLVRGEDPKYDPAMMNIIKYGLDPDMYPDISWQDELLKKATWGLSANVGVSGGGEIARYYISGNFRTNDAAYKQSGLERYNTNVLRKQYTFRANVDVNVTQSTLVNMNISTDIVNMNHPGIGSTSSIWEAQANLNPMRVPLRYSNGQLPAYGEESNQASPVVLLNETGFVTDYSNQINTTLGIKQDFSMLTKGLSASLSVSFDANTSQSSSRTKMPELWLAKGRDAKGNLITERKVEKQQVQFKSKPNGGRQFYMEAKIDYGRVFGKHRVGALLLYNQTQVNSSSTGLDAISSKIGRAHV